MRGRLRRTPGWRRSVCWLSWLTLGAGHPLAAQKQTGTIVGEVRDAASGADIEGARVLVEATGRVSVTSRSGGFTIADLAPASYRLRVAAVGYAPGEPPEVVVSGGDTAHVLVSVTPSSIWCTKRRYFAPTATTPLLVVTSSPPRNSRRNW